MTCGADSFYIPNPPPAPHIPTSRQTYRHTNRQGNFFFFFFPSPYRSFVRSFVRSLSLSLSLSSLGEFDLLLLATPPFLSFLFFSPPFLVFVFSTPLPCTPLVGRRRALRCLPFWIPSTPATSNFAHHCRRDSRRHRFARYFTRLHNSN